MKLHINVYCIYNVHVLKDQQVQLFSTKVIYTSQENQHKLVNCWTQLTYYFSQLHDAHDMVCV